MFLFYNQSDNIQCQQIMVIRCHGSFERFHHPSKKNSMQLYFKITTTAYYCVIHLSLVLIGLYRKYFIHTPSFRNDTQGVSKLFSDTDNFLIMQANLTLNVRGPSYLGLTRSISWLLMPWLLTSPGHQQPWYWLCRIGRFLSYLRKDFNYLRRTNVEKWHKM